jgi:predicted nuclease with TOPRIM domain
MDSELKTKLATIHNNLTTTITDYYDNKIAGLETKIEELGQRLDSQGVVVISLEEEREKNLVRIRTLEEQYRQLEDDFKNYQKVSIVKNLNTQLHEKDIELQILKKKMDTMEMKMIIDATSVQLVGSEDNSELLNKTTNTDEEQPANTEEEHATSDEEVDLIEKKLKPPNGTGRKAYYITDDENHDIYEKLENGEVGECIGKLVGKAQRPHFFQ